MTLRTKLIIAGALLALLAGYAGWRQWKTHRADVHLRQADVHEQAQIQHGAAAEVHEHTAMILAHTVADDDTAVEQAQEHLDQLVPPAPATPVDTAKDALIGVLKKEVADLKAVNAELAQADQERQAQVGSLKAEVVQLRASIAARPKDLRWSANALYGSDRTLGVGVDYDASVLRFGLDAVRKQVAGGQTSLELIAHIGVRF